MTRALPDMSRRWNLYTRRNQILLDALIFASALVAAFLIRFEGRPDADATRQCLLWLPGLASVRLLVNGRLGIYRLIWRYVSLSDAVVIGLSLALVTVVVAGVRILYPGGALWATWVRLPLSVIALEFLLSMTGSLGARALRRILFEYRERRGVCPKRSPRRVLLYGAGRSGLLLLRELQNQADVEVVGFLDDDPAKVGTLIFGAKVLGGGESLEHIARHSRAGEVVVCMGDAPRKTLGEILDRCKRIGMPAKIIPSIEEIVRGHLSISEVRELRFEDLLGRDSFEAAEVKHDVGRVYSDKRILVTGAGGSIGRELVRQLLRLHPRSIAILDKDENSIYELEQELAFRFPGACVEPHVADLRLLERLRAVFAACKPQAVFHAAAHKHLPLMERHPCEAVLNNVLGTKTLLDVCTEHIVERLVFISTDKAVNPTSVLGATKRVGELLTQAYAGDGIAASACVRFGNVMGSRGSVIPLFQKQIAAGGPLTVTHPEVVRFFMTIPEAIQLVLCAGTLGERGEVFVLDMGNPRKIMDLAQEMVRLAGLVPGEDIEITITGLRPGEKLVEELVGEGEQLVPTQFDKLNRIVSMPRDGRGLLASASALVKAAQDADTDQVYSILLSMGIGFHPQRGSPVELGIAC